MRGSTWSAVLRRFAELRRRKGVVSVGVGQRHRAGAFHPTEPTCLVVTVRSKRGDVHPRALLPRVLAFEGASIPVDVVDAGGDIQVRAPVTVAANGAVVGRGALSYLVRDAGSPAATIAGHVGPLGASVAFPGGARGRVVERRFGDLDDLAVVELEIGPPPPTDPGRPPLIGFAPAGQALVGQVCELYAPTAGRWVETTVREVSIAAHAVNLQGQPVSMRGLVRCDRVTERGDSGAVLRLRNQPVAVGTLLGGTPTFDFFVPSVHAFVELGLSLV